MRRVEVMPPSFPEVSANEPLAEALDRLFLPFCGDPGHWRAGWYRPEATRADEISTLETHSCPELFLLLEGRASLVLGDAPGGRTLDLQRGRPVLVTAPHAAFCPDGPRRALLLVVERDRFETVYADRGSAESAGA
jgi:hypothetical protein